MIDLTEVFDRLSHDPGNWTSASSSAAAAEFARLARASVDWDSDAGEDWISVLSGDARVAMFSARWPIAFARAGQPGIGESTEWLGVRLVQVESFDEAELLCDPALLEGLFGDTATLLSSSGFSANELWFATI